MPLDSTSILLSNISDVGEMIALAELCEQVGIPRVWLAETAGAEAASMGAVIASRTRLEVGTAIVPVYSRTPAVLGMMASTWHRLNGRTVHLGIGAGGQGIVEKWHGVPYARPLATTRDTLRILRSALSGERTDYTGDSRVSSGLRLGLGAADVRLHVGGVGPKMMELAAAEGDGLIVTWLSPSMIANIRPEFDAAIAAAGRARDDVRLIARVYVGVGDDVDAIRESVRKELVEYVVSPGYGRLFAKVGYGPTVEAVGERVAARDRDGAVAAVPDALLDELLVVGRSADDIHALLAAHWDAGADEILVQPVPAARFADPARTIAAVADACR